MKKFFVIASTLLLAAGCMHDGGNLPGGPGDPGGDPVEITTRAALGGTADGLVLGSVRIIALDRATGTVVFNRLRTTSGGSLGFEPGEHGDLTVGNFTVSLLPGIYDFRAVVNELASWQLDAITTRTALEAVTLQRTAMPADEAMVCTGSVAGVLPEKFRLPMVLHYVEGYKTEEIAAILRLPGAR